MKHILMMTEAYGGGIKTHFDLINKYSSRLENCKVIFYISENRLNSTEQNNLYNCIINNKMSDFKKISSLHKNLKMLDATVLKNDIKIIHAHSTIAGLLVKLYTIFYKKRNIKVIYTPHGYFSQGEYSYIKKKIISLIEKFIEKDNQTIHVSNGENVHSRKFKISEKATIISNGVEIPNKKIKKKKNNEITLGYLGRAEYPKNVERFIEIANFFENSMNKKGEIKFIFGGSGKEIEKIKRIVSESNINNVQLTGMIDKNKFFEKIDVYMSTSKYEGLPFSVIEAMSHKKPLILSNINGHLDFKKSSATLLFDLESDNNKIVEQIFDFIFKSDFKQLENKIFDDFLNHFSVEDMIQKLNKLYKNTY